MTGEKIKSYRKSLGMSQADFSEKIGIRQGHLSEIERGTKNPGGKILVSLFRLFPDLRGAIIEKDEETPVKQPESGDLTRRRGALSVEEAQERYGDGKNFFMPAIGAKMTPYPITEGEMMVISPSEEPQDGDFVLTSSEDGPIIIRWTPGTASLGVVMHTSKDREALRKSGKSR